MVPIDWDSSLTYPCLCTPTIIEKYSFSLTSITPTFPGEPENASKDDDKKNGSEQKQDWTAVLQEHNFNLKQSKSFQYVHLIEEEHVENIL